MITEAVLDNIINCAKIASYIIGEKQADSSIYGETSNACGLLFKMNQIYVIQKRLERYKAINYGDGILPCVCGCTDPAITPISKESCLTDDNILNLKFVIQAIQNSACACSC